MSLRPAVLCLFGMLPSVALAGPMGYYQTNLVSDLPGIAATTDPDLKNPWGISFGNATPFWTADNGTGLSTLYNGSGVKAALIVTIPPPGGSPVGTLGTPTGTVFNSDSGSGTFMGDRFLFATEDGTIAGWQGGTVASIRVDMSSADAIFKGLAIAGTRIYATDFGNGMVDVFDSGYAPVSLGGSAFTDPNLPSGFSPFGIQAIGSSIFVTYAMKQPGGDDDVAGPGFGYVDRYDADGALLQRLVSAGPLSSPWGVTVAPAGFGDLAGLLLVGNFGDGKINAFDPTTGTFVSSLNNTSGKPIAIDGLWGLQFRSQTSGFDPNKLYFTAGLNDEENGLFGSLQQAPEPGTLLLLSGGLLLGFRFRDRLSS